jgi:PAS domain S-box-containing protein
MDAEGLVTEWDEGAEMLFGYTRERAVGQPVSELIVPPELRPAHVRGLRRVASGGASALAGKTVELPALDAHERRFRVELTIADAGLPRTRFLGTIAVVGTHSATLRPDSAEA